MSCLSRRLEIFKQQGRTKELMHSCTVRMAGGHTVRMIADGGYSGLPIGADAQAAMRLRNLKASMEQQLQDKMKAIQTDMVNHAASLHAQVNGSHSVPVHLTFSTVSFAFKPPAAHQTRTLRALRYLLIVDRSTHMSNSIL